MIGHVALRCKIEPIFDEVFVATCDEAIAEFCSLIGVKSVMTANTHERATDRVHEAVKHVEVNLPRKVELVTMVQGDEPMVTPSMLRAAVDGIISSGADCVNLRSPITDLEEFKSANCVKVVVDVFENAMYFSREAIPSSSKFKGEIEAYKQVCVIPFRRDFLEKYSSLAPTSLEEVESIDMNRCLEHGYKVRCVKITELSYPVDVPEDLVRVEKELKNCPYLKSYLQR
jgi:3-deoxy-manno-octulosonate cytidylyltransferase (CMP-KDO synthetase)